MRHLSAVLQDERMSIIFALLLYSHRVLVQAAGPADTVKLPASELRGLKPRHAVIDPSVLPSLPIAFREGRDGDRLSQWGTSPRLQRGQARARIAAEVAEFIGGAADVELWVDYGDVQRTRSPSCRVPWSCCPTACRMSRPTICGPNYALGRPTLPSLPAVDPHTPSMTPANASTGAAGWPPTTTALRRAGTIRDRRRRRAGWEPLPIQSRGSYNSPKRMPAPVTTAARWRLPWSWPRPSMPPRFARRPDRRHGRAGQERAGPGIGQLAAAAPGL